MEIDINRILSFISVIILFWPLYLIYKGQNKLKIYLILFFSFRMIVELIGICSNIFSLGIHFQYHIYSLLEFYIFLTVFYKINPTKFYKPLLFLYTIVWILFRIVDTEGVSENFAKPVDMSVWTTTIIMLILYGGYLLRFDFKDGIRNTYSLLSLSIIMYLIIIITFILYKNSIIGLEMSRELKIQLIRERYIWHVSFMILSTVLFVIGIKYLPKTIDKEKNISNI